VVAGYLGEDGRLHITHDRSSVMASDAWARAACELAADTEADCFIYEKNYGGDMVLLTIRTAWEALRREQPARFSEFVPRLIGVTSRRGKMLRAEPIGQQWKEGKIVTTAYLPDLESEWATYMPGSLDSPGRIDASVHLAYELLPVPSAGNSSLAGAVALSDTPLLNWGR
jgi:phage terminase large subunit-like protein